jgi:hypothetical protein
MCVRLSGRIILSWILQKQLDAVLEGELTRERRGAMKRD